MAVCKGGNLRQMRNANHLMRLGERFKLDADFLRRTTADARVNFVKYQCADIIFFRKYAFNRQHDAGKFTARSNFRKRFWRFPGICRQQKFNVIYAVFG